MATTTKPTVAATTTTAATNSPGLLVLQWLTYAFWGWTALALIWLTGVSVNFFIGGQERSTNDTDTIAYSLAAVIVLFIISLICDMLYARREPLEKHGASMVIMIVHAVIFALFAIGSLIAAVFAVVNLLIGSSRSDDAPLTILITGLIMAVVYGATLLRTLRPFKIRRVTLVYSGFMGLVVLGAMALGILGPTLSAIETRDDRLIERALPDISDTIRSYTAKNNQLPASLVQVRNQVSSDAKSLIDRGLVEYKPGKKVTSNTRVSEPADVYEYTLCVTYKAKKGEVAYTGTSLSKPSDVTPETYYHDAGQVCYDLRTSYYPDRYY